MRHKEKKRNRCRTIKGLKVVQAVVHGADDVFTSLVHDVDRVIVAVAVEDVLVHDGLYFNFDELMSFYFQSHSTRARSSSSMLASEANVIE